MPDDLPPPPGVDRYAVLGHPVAHSRSPFIHARFAAQCGQRLHYGRVDCGPDGFDATLRALLGAHRDDGVAPAARPGPLRGVNVTVPFKFDVPRRADTVTARAARAGAANVLRFEHAADGGVRAWADNTDGIGLVRDLTVNAGVALAGTRILLVGAGGAGAGVLGPLLEARPAAVDVANRSAERATALVDRHADLAAAHGVALRGCALDATDRGYDVVLNASAASLAGAGVPVGDGVLQPGAVAVDLMYGPAAAPFLGWAERRGARALDGLGMLVEQAAFAFEAWRGMRPDTAPVLAALRAALQAPTAGR